MSGAGRCHVEGIELGPFATNSYIVWPEGEKVCWVVDPSFEPEELIERVRELGLTPTAIVLTHAHVDHIAGVDEVLREFGAGLPVLVHRAEKDWLSDPMKNLSVLGGFGVTAKGPTGFIDEGEGLTLGATEWKVLHTPGHSPGGVTLWHEPSGVALVGDTLFAGSVGRTDFPGCDGVAMERSIREKLYRFPDETRVYPGHGPPTTIGREKRSNPFVRG